MGLEPTSPLSETTVFETVRIAIPCTSPEIILRRIFPGKPFSSMRSRRKFLRRSCLALSRRIELRSEVPQTPILSVKLREHSGTPSFSREAGFPNAFPSKCRDLFRPHGHGRDVLYSDKSLLFRQSSVGNYTANRAITLSAVLVSAYRGEFFPLAISPRYLPTYGPAFPGTGYVLQQSHGYGF